MDDCLCGEPAVKLKWGVPVCRRCDDLENRGFIGGKYNKAQNAALCHADKPK